MATDLEKIRAIIKDFRTPPIVTDIEVATILEVEDNIFRAAAMVARSYAAYFAQKSNADIGPISLDSSSKSEAYLDLAKQLDTRAQQGAGGAEVGVSGGGIVLTGISNSEIESVKEDSDRYDSSFYRGLNDNPSTFDYEEE